MSKKNGRASYKTHGERLFQRDGAYVCKYCDTALVPPRVAQSDYHLYYYLPQRAYAWDMVNNCQGDEYETYITLRPEYRDGTVDHVMPVCKGGSNDMDNLVLCCWECNTSKNVHTLEQWAEVKARRAKS